MNLHWREVSKTSDRSDWHLMVGTHCAAIVYSTGTWHTFDGDGNGGENDKAMSVAEAKVQAAASAIDQGFIFFEDENDRTIVCDISDLASHVVGELLAVIDIDQGFSGWARKYRRLFRCDFDAFPTLADALKDLSKEISRD